MQAIWIFFYLIVNIFSQIVQNQNDEVTLFDRRGKAIAYIAADEDRTIYMWDGTPVAYILHKGETYHIYGFNGKHIGWFENGFVRDHRGDVVGCIEGITRMICEVEPLKSMKQDKPHKKRMDEPSIKTTTTKFWSNTPFAMFLRAGRDK